MAEHHHRDTFDNQVDPFNAPDPIMPGGEQSMDPGDTSGGGLERFGRRRRRGGPSRRQAAHNYQAPIERPDAYEAPSTDGTPGTVARERARQAKAKAREKMRAAKSAATGGRGGRRRGCLIVIIFLFVISGVASALVESCGALFDDLVSSDSATTSYGDYDADYGYDVVYTSESALEEHASSQLPGMFDELLADEGGTLTQELAGAFDENFTAWCMVPPAEVGIDSTEVARWVLDNTVCELDSIYANATSDPYGDVPYEVSVYFYCSSPDVDDLCFEMSDHFSDLRARRGSAVLPEDLAEITATFEDVKERVLSETEADTPAYVSLECTGSIDEDGSNPRISINPDSWEEAKQHMLHLY